MNDDTVKHTRVSVSDGVEDRDKDKNKEELSSLGLALHAHTPLCPDVLPMIESNVRFTGAPHKRQPPTWLVHDGRRITVDHVVLLDTGSLAVHGHYLHAAGLHTHAA